LTDVEAHLEETGGPMPENRGASNRAVRLVRWIARAIGSLAAAFWLFAGAASAMASGDPWTWESTVLTLLIVASALSVLVAWRREGIGGTLVVMCGIAHSAFASIAAGHNKGLAMLMTGGPLVISGILFLGGWWGWRRTGNGLSDVEESEDE
jgi:hypothetical protein